MDNLSKVFRVYDIRGVYPEEITEDLAYKVGRAFRKFIGKGKIVFSADLRDSSLSLKEAFLKGLLSEEGEVVDVGFGTSPYLYFSACKEKASGAAMITASHLPLPYNGLKLTKDLAKPISNDQGLDKIYELILKDNSKLDTRAQRGILFKKDLSRDYVNFLISQLSQEERKALLDFGKVVLDSGNGMTGSLLPLLFNSLGLKAEFLYLEPDFSFPNHIADPAKEESLKDLSKSVIKNKADLGLAFDGDGDRLGVVDDQGKVVPPYIIGTILAEEMIKRGQAKKFLYDVTVSNVFPEKVKELGAESFRVRVGHSLVKEKMRELEADMGLEYSGHFTFKFSFDNKLAYFDDALAAGIKLLGILARKKENLSSLRKNYQKYSHSGVLSFRVKDRRNVINKVKDFYSKMPKAKLSFLDGVRVDTPLWWLVVRPSNTEDLIRVAVEAQSEDLKEQVLKELLSLVK